MPEKRKRQHHTPKKQDVGGERKVLFGMSVALVVTLFITGCLIGIVLTRDTAAATPEETPEVIIDSVELIKKSTTTDLTQDLEVDVYIDITNVGKVDVDVIQVRLIVEESDSTLGLALQDTVIKDLAVMTTKSVVVPVSLPRDAENYNIKIKLYVNNMLMVRGQSLVKLGAGDTMSGQAFTTTENRSDDIVGDNDDDGYGGGASSLFDPQDDAEKAGGALSVGFAGLIFVIIIIIIAILVIIAIRKATKDENSGDEENIRQNNDNP